MFINPIKEWIADIPPHDGIVKPHTLIRIFIFRECVNCSNYKYNPCKKLKESDEKILYDIIYVVNKTV